MMMNCASYIKLKVNEKPLTQCATNPQNRQPKLGFDSAAKVHNFSYGNDGE